MKEMNFDGKPILMLISINWYRKKDPCIPLSQSSLATEVIKELVEQEKLHLVIDKYSVCTPILEIFTRIFQIKPDFLGWGVYVWNESQTRELLEILQKFNFPGKIILGGPQITFCDKNLNALYPRGDYFIKGEGENPFTTLLDNLCRNRQRSSENSISAYSTISNSALKEIYFHKSLKNLHSTYLTGIYQIEHKQDFIRWETQRGCPYSCTFCSHRLVKRPVRSFPLERLFKEIDLFKKKEVQEIMVLDPIFNSNREHSSAILTYIAECNLPARLKLQCRLELLNENFLNDCLNLRNPHLEFGLQTLNTKVSQIIRRKNNYKKINQKLDLLNETNISYEVHLIYGLPLQTRQSLTEGVNHLVEKNVPTIRLFPLQLLRGTVIEKQREKWNFRTSPFFPHHVLENTTFSFDDWLWASALVSFIEKWYNKSSSNPTADELWVKFNQIYKDSTQTRYYHDNLLKLGQYNLNLLQLNQVVNF